MREKLGSKYGTHLLLLASTLIFLNAQSANAACPAPDAAAAALETQVSEQITKLNCDIANITAEIRANHEIVPSRIYHYGKKPFLMEDIQARNVPDEPWTKFIMGDVTRFNLGGSRRGLYGTGGIEANSFGGGDYNWLMEIRIKEECRKPERVVTYPGLTSDERFKDWYKKRKGPEDPTSDLTYDQFSTTCYWGDVPNMNFHGFNDKKCEAIIQQFLREAKIGIVQDHIITKSFYIRDKSCIETINGLPDEWIELFAEEDYLWSTKCGITNQSHLPGLLLQTLAESTKPISDATVAKLKKNVDSLFPTDTYNFRPLLSSAIDAAVRCRKKNSFDAFNGLVKSHMNDSIDVGGYSGSTVSIPDLNALCP